MEQTRSRRGKRGPATCRVADLGPTVADPDSLPSWIWPAYRQVETARGTTALHRSCSARISN